MLDQHRELLAKVSERLTEFYGTPDLDHERTAVDELVLTYLSQNTNDINRDKAYASLKSQFATYEEVRDADPQEVKDCIRVAGLANQKGPNIQAGLRAISERAGEINLDFLKEMEIEEARGWLTNLKGVGPKTAAIVLVFSMGMPAFPVDTHVYRVSGRIGFRSQQLDVAKTHTYLESIGDPSQFGPLHLNLIRLGREICQARKPKCPVCPVNDLCQYPEKTK
ncbi:MAG: hypothetical protein WBI14_02455 [Anaerolineaceae bacterium]